MSQGRWDTHWDAGHNWALILAGGEGTRLQSLTRMASGIAVPKQFCSLGHSGSLAANGQRLLRHFEQSCPGLVGEMQHIVASVTPSAQMSRLAELYACSLSIDFSRHILQRSIDSLRVLRVPACGWSDLGTPHRLMETVHRIKSQASALATAHTDPSAFLNLAGCAPGMYASG